jgi:acetyl-CoA synthetase
MPFEIIEKPAGITCNLADYDAEVTRFDWAKAREELDGLPDGRGLNIAHEAVDRHVAPRGDVVALRCISSRGVVELTYRGLAAQSNRFANVLAELGVEPGDRVFTLAGGIPDLYVAVLGALKHRCVVSPLFSAFGPEPIETRMRLGKAHVLVTTDKLYRKKVAPIRDKLPELEHVLFAGDELAGRLAAASDTYTVAPTDPEDPALLHFTSGTTGTPKGALHVHQAVVAHHYTGKVALDLRPEDRYWCTADPGWVTGTSYGIVAPLTRGVTMLTFDGPFDVARWYELLQEEKITVWYTAPTAVRMFMRAGADLVRRYDLSALRFIGSVGEPLNPEAVVWGKEAFGLPIHDNWWQTETGAIMIANYAASPIKPGSMGRPIPGVEAHIVKRTHDGIETLEDAGIEGELALRSGWPSMFRTYLGEEERYRKCFVGDWYLTGDLAKRDEDGYFWFVGRADDVIKSAGHLIGPFEVESGLMEHEAVVEVAVIGKPDEVAGNIIKAFVSLRPGVEPTEELRAELLKFARKRLGPAVAPREIDFDQHLPKTRSGKIMRRLLRARELGLPEGDLSTLEEIK